MTTPPPSGSFLQPPRRSTADGRPRRVGFELEFSGVAIDEVAEVVAGRVGGSVRTDGPFVRTVDGGRWGDYQVEVDSSLLKDERYKRWVADLGIELSVEQWDNVDTVLLELADLGIPFELVTPPIPLNDLELMDDLAADLHDLRAKGTGASPVYAFGMQFNPEIPDRETGTIVTTVRAFLVLYDWLKSVANVDLSRRIAPYVNRFPDAYVDLVLDPGYRPDLETFARDYLEHNPTRDRPLDLLPLLHHLLGDHVLEAVRDPHLVKPRPTFHYRLPDCRIDEPGWRPSVEWNRWVAVERLAEDPERLGELAADRLAEVPPLHRRIQQWFEEWSTS
jgi:hypothetical protein